MSLALTYRRNVNPMKVKVWMVISSLLNFRRVLGAGYCSFSFLGVGLCFM